VQVDLDSPLLLSQISEILVLEQLFKQITIATDIIKCYNREMREKSEIELLMKDEEFKLNSYQRSPSFKKGKNIPTNFELEFQVTEDLSIYVHNKNRMMARLRL
jgi:hypothetical protein